MLGDSLRRRRGTRHPAPPEEREREPTDSRRYTWAHWVVAGLVVLAGSFGVGYLLSTQVLFPPPETAGTGVAVPSLYGEGRAEAEAAITGAGLVLGTVFELPSTEAERGEVLAQDPVPGQQLRRGAAVSLAVSSGPPVLRVPPVRGLGPGTARAMLESLGFDVEVRETEGGDVPGGEVLASEPEGGTARTLPALVTLVVAPGPPMDTLAPLPDSLLAPGRGTPGADTLMRVEPLLPRDTGPRGGGAAGAR